MVMLKMTVAVKSTHDYGSNLVEQIKMKSNKKAIITVDP